MFSGEYNKVFQNSLQNTFGGCFRVNLYKNFWKYNKGFLEDVFMYYMRKEDQKPFLIDTVFQKQFWYD